MDNQATGHDQLLLILGSNDLLYLTVFKKLYLGFQRFFYASLLEGSQEKAGL